MDLPVDVLIATFLANVMFGGLVNCVGLVHAVLLERYHEVAALTSWAGALHSALFMLGAPLSSVVIDRFDCRTAMVTSGFLLTAGNLATAFADNIYVAIVTYGIICGLGLTLAMSASYVTIAFHFKEKSTNLAQGVILVGVGFGTLACSFLLQVSRDHYGIAGMFIIMAGISANIVTCGMVCKPNKAEEHAKIGRKLGVKGVNDNENGSNMRGIVSIPSRLLTGVLANFSAVNEVYIYSVTICLLGIATCLYPLMANVYSGHVVYGTLVGMLYGCCHVVVVAINRRFVSTHFISAALGVVHFGNGLGSVLGPIVGGIVLDSGLTYTHSMFIAGASLLISSVFGIILVCLPIKKFPHVPNPTHQSGLMDENTENETPYL
ncbi:MOT9-like protein [Mya arenaria]|uniref:MOT9-like protein n=1 Tax=Mya arenaria TaxID=6604 RepID=A0ABY7FL44_MYAAR|nr:MOT9-like protein [Mya arenaria]